MADTIWQRECDYQLEGYEEPSKSHLYRKYSKKAIYARKQSNIDLSKTQSIYQPWDNNNIDSVHYPLNNNNNNNNNHLNVGHFGDEISMNNLNTSKIDHELLRYTITANPHEYRNTIGGVNEESTSTESETETETNTNNGINITKQVINKMQEFDLNNITNSNIAGIESQLLNNNNNNKNRNNSNELIIPNINNNSFNNNHRTSNITMNMDPDNDAYDSIETTSLL